MTKTTNHLDVDIFAEIAEENHTLAELDAKIKALTAEFDAALDNGDRDLASHISVDLCEAINDHTALVNEYASHWFSDYNPDVPF